MLQYGKGMTEEKNKTVRGRKEKYGLYCQHIKKRKLINIEWMCRPTDDRKLHPVTILPNTQPSNNNNNNNNNT
jgi:hypothetical protein